MDKITDKELELLTTFYDDCSDCYTETVIARAAMELKEYRSGKSCTCEACKSGRSFIGLPSIFCRRYGIYKAKDGYCDKVEPRG